MTTKTTGGPSALVLDSIRKMPGSDRMNDADRATVLQRSSEMFDRINRLAKDRDGLAKDLIALRNILKPLRLWDAFLRLDICVHYGISKATVHRIINAHIETKVIHPFPVARMALLPPGKAPAPEIITAQKQPARAAGRWRSELTADQSAREIFNYARTRLALVPQKHRGTALRMLVGTLMTQLGVGNEMSFKPVAIPDDWRRRKNSVA